MASCPTWHLSNPFCGWWMFQGIEDFQSFSSSLGPWMRLQDSILLWPLLAFLASAAWWEARRHGLYWLMAGHSRAGGCGRWTRCGFEKAESSLEWQKISNQVGEGMIKAMLQDVVFLPPTNSQYIFWYCRWSSFYKSQHFTPSDWMQVASQSGSHEPGSKEGLYDDSSQLRGCPSNKLHDFQPRWCWGLRPMYLSTWTNMLSRCREDLYIDLPGSPLLKFLVFPKTRPDTTHYLYVFLSVYTSDSTRIASPLASCSSPVAIAQRILALDIADAI